MSDSMTDPLTSALASRIANAEADMLGFLERLVNTESPTEERALAEQAGDLLQAKAESLGMVCTRDPQTRFADNRICRLVPAGLPATAPRILLIGHFDTVYPSGTVAERPFRITDGRAFGPGVVDMKSGLTIGLYALDAIQRELGALPFAVTFIFNSDEEIGSPCSRAVILKEAARHDLALVLEPGGEGQSVVARRKGVGIFTLDVAGVEAHAGAEPEKGANALVEMAHKTLALTALADPGAGTTINPGVIEGGTKPYVVPGTCRLTIDIRVPSAEEQARVEAGLKDIIARTHVSRTTSRLAGSFHRPPMETSDASRAHLARLQALSTELGFPLGETGSGGASDGNLTAASGTPTIDGLGPHGGRAHSPDEFMDVATMVAKCQILAAFLATMPHTG